LTYGTCDGQHFETIDILKPFSVAGNGILTVFFHAPSTFFERNPLVRLLVIDFEM
jgi:hypothetical protein